MSSFASAFLCVAKPQRPGRKSLAFIFFVFVFPLFAFANIQAKQQTGHTFRCLTFFTGKNDKAHISFVKEANQWFTKMAKMNNFVYDTTTDWNKLNSSVLKNYKVILFLDSRPELPHQRKAFENYMANGGGWIGFHFAAFSLTPSDFPQNWDWYHNYFLGAGQYVSNTWRPTSASLKVENSSHPIVKGVPGVFRSAPNEWYRWEKDVSANPDIDVILSIDSTSFPLGTGPKPHEIWHHGYFPVVWSNRKFNMVYFNMGHNDIDYEHGTNKSLSFTFDNNVQNRLILNTVLLLGRRVGKVSI